MEGNLHLWSVAPAMDWGFMKCTLVPRRILLGAKFWSQWPSSLDSLSVAVEAESLQMPTCGRVESRICFERSSSMGALRRVCSIEWGITDSRRFK